MNIGFFGDSYVDLNIDFHISLESKHPLNQYKGSLNWPFRLCNDLEYTPISSGLGGSNQYYAIKTWQDTIKTGVKIDYAIFTFTWNHRLYSHRSDYDYSLLRNWAERRELNDLTPHEEKVLRAMDTYFELIYNEEQSVFTHELMIKWILDLPEKYPNTKFIFLPNTETSLQLALRHFKRGILLDFAFEKISLLEGERVGIDPYFNTKFGHLTDINHDRIKDLIKKVIFSYNTFEGRVYPVDYKQFRID